MCFLGDRITFWIEETIEARGSKVHSKNCELFKDDWDLECEGREDQTGKLASVVQVQVFRPFHKSNANSVFFNTREF